MQFKNIEWNLLRSPWKDIVQEKPMQLEPPREQDRSMAL